ncbi:hypothetical protein KKB40_03595 [Patescibacteria group bacterium]|nr:hypothetical protein [Patescibacteria group bacterium]
MKVFVFAATLVVFLVGVVFNFGYRDKLEREVVEQQTPEVLSLKKEEDEKSFENEENEEKVEEDLKLAEPFPTPTLVLSPAPQLFLEEIFDYQYPNSEIVNSSDNSLLLTSTDETDAIINWYKEKIRNERMSVKTFVTTKINKEVLSKLVGADGEKEIRIEISKTDNSATTEISVVFLENN